MELRQLRYFIAIVEAGSFSKAALDCNVVQSALSQQISALEEELGRTLLTRSSRGVSVTAAGELLYQQAQHILRQVEHTAHLVGSSRSVPAGRVSIGLPNSTAVILSSPLIVDCFSRYPNIRLHTLEGLSRHVHQHLNKGVVDIAILFSSQRTHGLVTQPLLTEELFIVASPEARKPDRRIGTFTLSQLMETPLFLPERGNGLRDFLDELFTSVGVVQVPRAEIGTVATQLDVVKRGLGATILPWAAFSKEYEAGTVSAHRLENISMPRTLLLCTSGTFPISDAANAVFDLLLDNVHELINTGQWSEVYLHERRA